ncbi:hypothetical protein HEK616_10310 [Streptomyces nigrescens]|uniref:4Fe-4S Wbl-type domain-containing protein n=1 Tax=Streptomyces nigrescens TaxID=1920 RepID=A0ABM7ZN41_STRNI|nr:hypothetical protein [Streptomyces nigrescens]BDM67544.1 hypothetical protein HEK616_10310 [Streptomyces nigrescens]
MSGNGWAGKAPCAGDLRFTPEETTAEAPTEPLVALLDICQGCPFRAQCIGLVLPRASLFDGVCGGRVWRNGQVLATCDDAQPSELRERGRRPMTHGTEAGARAHNRRGERACSLCREAGRLAQQARRARKRASGT